jgi:hypothetical protein
MTERRRRPRTVLRVRDTARCDDDNLGGAALMTSECDLRGWHVTDDPAKLIEAIESGNIVKEEKAFQELGPGLYISAVPHVWTGRSTKKWAFLSKLDKSERRTLALALVETTVRWRVSKDGHGHDRANSHMEPRRDHLRRRSGVDRVRRIRKNEKTQRYRVSH